MPAPDIETLTRRFKFAANVGDAVKESALDDAAGDVKVKIGVEAYGEVFNAETSTQEDSEFLDDNETVTDEDELRVSRVTSAVYYYAAAYLVVSAGAINMAGMVSKETANESPGTGRQAQVEVDYLKPTEVEAKAAQLRSQADRLISAYVVEQAPQNPYGWGRSARG